LCRSPGSVEDQTKGRIEGKALGLGYSQNKGPREFIAHMANLIIRTLGLISTILERMFAM